MHIFCMNKISKIPFRFSLKIECEKLAQEKTEMQRHYVMVRVFETFFCEFLKLKFSFF